MNKGKLENINKNYRNTHTHTHIHTYIHKIFRNLSPRSPVSTKYVPCGSTAAHYTEHIPVDPGFPIRTHSEGRLIDCFRLILKSCDAS